MSTLRPYSTHGSSGAGNSATCRKIRDQAGVDRLHPGHESRQVRAIQVELNTSLIQLRQCLADEVAGGLTFGRWQAVRRDDECPARNLAPSWSRAIRRARGRSARAMLWQVQSVTP